MKTTPWIVLALLHVSFPIHAGEPGHAKTIAYVKSCQDSDGGYKPYNPGAAKNIVRPTLGATSAAVRALAYLGSETPNKAGVIRFVESCYDASSGGFSNYPSAKPDVTSTAIGLLAVAELKMPVEKFLAATRFLDKNATGNAKSFEDIRIAVAAFEAIGKKSAKEAEWIEVVRQRKNADGTFGTGAGMARDTGGSIVALMRMGVKAEPTPILKILNEGQHKTGGWGTEEMPDAADLASSYRVMRCYWMFKTQPTGVDCLYSFIAKCRNEDGGYGNVPGGPSSVGSTYYAAIMGYWLQKLE